jgi:predicted small lipoprotein YifL
MNRVLGLFLLGCFSASLTGCGGKTELGPAKSTPKVDQEKMQKEMMKSYELGKPKGKPPGGQ